MARSLLLVMMSATALLSVSGFFNPAPKLTDLERTILNELLESESPHQEQLDGIDSAERDEEDDSSRIDAVGDAEELIEPMRGQSGSFSRPQGSSYFSSKLLAVMRREYVIDSSYFRR